MSSITRKKRRSNSLYFIPTALSHTLERGIGPLSVSHVFLPQHRQSLFGSSWHVVPFLHVMSFVMVDHEFDSFNIFMQS